MISSPSCAQGDQALRPRPSVEVKVMIDSAKEAIYYSTPSFKGREIWGALVPDGKVWITVWRTKNRYLKYGIDTALEENKRPRQPVKYVIDHRAELSALACGPCPGGRKRWTIRLLTGELKKKPGFETANRESVRVALKKMNVSLG